MFDMRWMLYLIFFLLTLPVCCIAGEESIRVAGSTTMNPMMRRLIVAYRAIHPAREFVLTASGSGNGAIALALGRADVALLSRAMEKDELRYCRVEGVEPERFTVALDGLVPIVHKDNPVTGLSIDQIRSIYGGEARNWQDVGGPDMPIIAFGRDNRSGSHEIWHSKVMGGMVHDDMRVRLVESNEVMVQAVQIQPGAIGYVGLGFVGPGMNGLMVDGIPATLQTVSNGSYPLARTLNLYIDKDAPAWVRLFVDFVLGPTGREIIEDEGFVLVP